jgi:hypothetical protein
MAHLGFPLAYVHDIRVREREGADGLVGGRRKALNEVGGDVGGQDLGVARLVEEHQRRSHTRHRTRVRGRSSTSSSSTSIAASYASIRRSSTASISGSAASIFGSGGNTRFTGRLRCSLELLREVLAVRRRRVLEEGEHVLVQPLCARHVDDYVRHCQHLAQQSPCVSRTLATH